MDLVDAFYTISWILPMLLAGVITVVLSIVRRDEGAWWKLVLGGGALLVASSFVALCQQVLISVSQPDSFTLFRILGLVQTALLVAAISLIVAGAFMNRRGPAPRSLEPHRVP